MGLEHFCGNGASPCYAEGATIMNNLLCAELDPSGNNCVRNDLNNSTFGRESPSECDNKVIKCQVYRLCPTPTPTPVQTPDPAQNCEPPYGVEYSHCPVGTFYNSTIGLCCPAFCPDPPMTYPCEFFMSEQLEGETCPYYVQRPCGATPIVVDVAGNGFNLTSVGNGVDFNLYNNPDGRRERFSWTAADSDDAWLVFDRNRNNSIDDGRELFGNFTPQPKPPAGEERNGFLALAEYDKAERGGNADGVIGAQDDVFNSLRLWQDKNHNGVSEADELHALGSANVALIELDYRESKRTDENGNGFRYRAKIKDSKNSKVGRWAWDVFLGVQ